MIKLDSFNNERERMVCEQLIKRGIHDERVLNSFRKVPRHLFMDLEDQAYEDHPVSIGYGQTISQPYIVAAMLELLELKGDEHVLEIGTGSGYQSALLAELVSKVYSIEVIEALLKTTQDRLQKLDYQNVSYYCSDGAYGWSEKAPFDAVIISAATPSLPTPLKEQVKVGGRIVYPEGSGLNQTLKCASRGEHDWEERSLFDCVFVPLTGDWAEK